MRLSAFAALALLVPVASLSAQDAETPAETTTQTAVITPEDDLDCALLVAAVLGAQEDGADPEEAAGLSTGLAYFLGRYEMVRGRDLSSALTQRYPTFLAMDQAALGETCGGRMMDWSNRMQFAGDQLTVLEESMAQEAAAATSPSE